MLRSGTGSVFHRNVYFLYKPLGLRAVEINGEQTVLELRGGYAHAIGQHKAALELPCGDAPVQEFPLRVVGLPTANDELVLFSGDLKVAFCESGNRQRDSQPLRGSVGSAKTFDIIGWIGIASLGETLKRLFHRIEPKEKRARKRRHSAHCYGVLCERHYGERPERHLFH